MQLILLGLPGAGKGTQAQLLAQHLGLLHVSTGDLFRAAAAEGTELGKRAQEYMSRGELVPDEVTISMLLDRIAKPDAAAGIMLDGCDACGGVWVQDGELQRIADHLRQAPAAFGGVAASRRHLHTLHTASTRLA